MQCFVLCRLVEGVTLHKWPQSQLQLGTQDLEQHVKTLLVELLEVTILLPTSAVPQKAILNIVLHICK